MPSTTDLLTRCPQCQTAFRVTAEQLAVRNGRVRCGKCQHAFDAPSASIDLPVASATITPPATPAAPAQPERPPVPPAAEPATPAPAASDEASHAGLPDISDLTGNEPAAASGEDDTLPASADQPDSAAIDSAGEEVIDAVIDEFPAHLLDPLEPTLGDYRTEVDLAPPEPIVADAAPINEEHDEPAPPAPTSHRTGWLFLLASLILILLLLGQTGYRFRTELATALPGLKDVYAALGINVPLPQHAEQISIEGSDLQADAARNLLILNASIKNRAPWSQAYPLLELTLTDARDTVLLRRSLKPADYLPADSPPVFGPHADLAIRLWLDTHGAVAAGYRLYVYYP